MTVQTADGRILEIDRRYLREWVAFGISEFEARLAKEARFEEYVKANPDYRKWVR